MVAEYVTNFERLVSKPRLDRYRPQNRDDLETIVNYLWNVALSEALLQGVSAVEVGFRNSIHRTLTAELGTAYWFWPYLHPEELDHFTRDWIKLRRALQDRPSPGKAVANQTFGFWQRIFHVRYDGFWSANRSRLLWDVFPYHPRSGTSPADWLTRNKVASHTKLFVDLRNRVMHHEPIFQGIARPDEQQSGQPMPMVSLIDAHRQMREFLGWIDPQLRGALDVVDRFSTIGTAAGKRQIETELKEEILRIHGHL
jgi:hypothetical protein